jgi:hypothetical protein
MTDRDVAATHSVDPARLILRKMRILRASEMPLSDTVARLLAAEDELRLLREQRA